MTMLEVAELGYFIIRYIQDFELDNTVGIGNKQPQVWLIPNKPLPERATPEQIQLLNPYQLSNMDEMEDRVYKRLRNLSNYAENKKASILFSQFNNLFNSPDMITYARCHCGRSWIAQPEALPDGKLQELFLLLSS